jgi:hypothetical protein
MKSLLYCGCLRGQAAAGRPVRLLRVQKVGGPYPGVGGAAPLLDGPLQAPRLGRTRGGTAALLQDDGGTVLDAQAAAGGWVYNPRGRFRLGGRTAGLDGWTAGFGSRGGGDWGAGRTGGSRRTVRQLNVRELAGGLDDPRHGRRHVHAPRRVLGVAICEDNERSDR